MNAARPSTPIAIIGLGAVMPDANDLATFWSNIRGGKYSIREVPRDRWLTEDHYDPDPKAPDKSYAKIGAFIRGFDFDSLSYRIPPRVAESMDDVQKWAVEASRQALSDAGYDKKDFDRNSTAVVIGNAMAGELQYTTNLRVYFPRYARALRTSQTFEGLPADTRERIVDEFHALFTDGLPPITEDSMPGELSNVIAGRVANVFGLRGPNFTADAACASSLAALEAAINGLAEQRYDMVLTGGTDSSMAPHSFVKFSKIGALSAKLSCPFDKRADGFVMGEGCGMLLLKRLVDAERDGDKIYAVVHGLGSSSDGKGKGITAPNPAGQQLALERAYVNSGLSPADVTMLEAHGTSTIAGDRAEGNLAAEFYGRSGAARHSIAMGSVKSQIGHLKSAAGAAALIKTALSIHHGLIPGSINFEQPNPDIPFDSAPVYVPRETVKWKVAGDKPRIAGLSAFGFGGTNFHAVLGEYRPAQKPRAFPAGGNGQNAKDEASRKMLAVGATDVQALRHSLEEALSLPREKDTAMPAAEVLSSEERIVIEHGCEEERAKRGQRALSALDSDNPAAWRALAGQGIFRGHGHEAKVAFIFPGQGSQYIGMFKELREQEPVVEETFREADRIMEPILGKPLSTFINAEDNTATREALRDTNVCQPAMLAGDIAMARLFEQYGIRPDMVAGHSLGEYAALVVSGMLSYPEALRAVSSRAREMSSVRVDDPGKMAAALASFDEILAVLDGLEGIVPANMNSRRQTVIAGASAPFDEAMRRLKQAEIRAIQLPVSHAFHSYIVAPAMKPLRAMLAKFDFHPPRIPLVANVDAQPYDPDPAAMSNNLDRLAQQIASPVRWVESIEKMYELGARVFIEVGAKRVLANLTFDILSDPEVVSTSSNNPKLGDRTSFNLAMAALAAAGLPQPEIEQKFVQTATTENVMPTVGTQDTALPEAGPEIIISGASLGLPGVGHPVFDENNTERILEGQACIDPIPLDDRRKMAGQRIVRLIKNAPGGPAFEVIESPDEVARLTGRKGPFDLAEEFGLDPKRVESYDITTRLAIAAGLLALRDAGIPLVMHHRKTSTGSRLPVGYRLPDELAPETGIIFASAFPGYDQLVQQMNSRQRDELYEARIAELRLLSEDVGPLHAVTRRIEQLEQERGERYGLDRKFIFRALAFGHAQMAELIGARGPNIQVNGACSSTTQAVAIASDWIRLGRCRRVLVVGADDITNPNLAPWLVGGLLATGAVTNEERLEKAALPFDRRRNGMIPGMGAVGMLVEDSSESRRRGVSGITRLLGSVVVNSAFHGTRLNVEHIAETMNSFIERMEHEHGFDRHQIAPQTVFVSHETYTPARGGSASAEVHALRHTFGPDAEKLVVANTKGFTGHPMGVGIEDAVAVRMLEHQIVPPIPNYKEVDPELGTLNLSRGGHHDIRYALRLAAGFGSQLAISLMERVPGNGERIREAEQLAWTQDVTGIAGPELEIVNKTLRVKDTTDYSRAAAASKTTADTSVAVGAHSDAPLHAVPEHKTPEPTPAPVAAAALDADAIEERILGIVAQKTGYPVEMLELDLDLEADLGIDTVKQAETFSEVRAAFGIPKQEDMKLSDYPTLGHIIRFAMQKAGAAIDAEPVPEAVGAHSDAPLHAAPVHKMPEPTPAPVATAALDADAIEERILGIVAQKTGYPVEMLELDLDLEADLGIDTVKQAETFSEVRAAFGIPKQEDMKLSDYPTLGHIIRFAIQKAGAAIDAEPVPEAVGAHSDAPLHAAPVHKMPEPTPVPVAAAALDADAIEKRILGIVAQKTGYPVEMLELDLDLEADLGIDTVKQAETFSEVRAAFGIPKQEDMKLSDYPTLGHIIRFAVEKSGAPEPASTPEPTTPQTAATEQAPQDKQVEPLISIEAESETVRFLAPVLVGRPRARECLPSGVDLASRSFIIGADNEIANTLAAAIKAKGGQPLIINGSGDPDSVANEVERLAGEDPPRGVWLLTALGDPVLPGGDPSAWQKAVDSRARLPFRVAKALDQALSNAPGSFFMAATRMGGHLGLRPGGGSLDPVAGATCGLVKSLDREWSQTLCKVVDMPADADADYIASTLIEEAEVDRGVCEVGRSGIRRWGVGLSEYTPCVEEEARAGMGCLPASDPVVLITGGAGDITGSIALDLASELGGSYYLVDLAPEPDQNDPDIELLGSDRDALKKVILGRLRKNEARVTPVMVERELRGVERRAAAIESLRAIRATGAEAHYVSLDVTDTAAVKQSVRHILDRHGRLDLVLHAAGLEHSQGISRKKPEAFDKIMGVKVHGLQALLSATHDVELKGLMLFGSVAGRFGNAGQTDYAAANDLLAKCTTWLRATRPGLQVFTLAFSGWDGRGMATRGSVPEQLKSAGITLIPIEQGASSVRRVLASGYSGELLVARSLGVLYESLRLDGVDLELLRGRLSKTPERFPMLGDVLDWTQTDGLRLMVSYDPSSDGFLDDHRIDGVAVLPGVMAVETFAEAAILMRPDLTVVAIEDLAFEAPLKLYRDEERIAVVRLIPTWDTNGRVILATMETERELAGGLRQKTRHFKARLRLDQDLPLVRSETVASSHAPAVDKEAIYRAYFHGPSFQVLQRVTTESDGQTAGWMSPGTELPPLRRPGKLMAKPMFTELAFQAAGMVEMQKKNRMGLPSGVRRLRLHRTPDGADTKHQVAAWVIPQGSNGETQYGIKVIDDRGYVLLELDGYRTSALPNALPDSLLAELAPRNQK